MQRRVSFHAWLCGVTSCVVCCVQVEVLNMRSDLVVKPWEQKLRELDAMWYVRTCVRACVGDRVVCVAAQLELAAYQRGPCGVHDVQGQDEDCSGNLPGQ